MDSKVLKNLNEKILLKDIKSFFEKTIKELKRMMDNSELKDKALLDNYLNPQGKYLELLIASGDAVRFYINATDSTHQHSQKKYDNYLESLFSSLINENEKNSFKSTVMPKINDLRRIEKLIDKIDTFKENVKNLDINAEMEEIDNYLSQLNKEELSFIIDKDTDRKPAKSFCLDMILHEFSFARKTSDYRSKTLNIYPSLTKIETTILRLLKDSMKKLKKIKQIEAPFSELFYKEEEEELFYVENKKRKGYLLVKNAKEEYQKHSYSIIEFLIYSSIGPISLLSLLKRFECLLKIKNYHWTEIIAFAKKVL